MMPWTGFPDLVRSEVGACVRPSLPTPRVSGRIKEDVPGASVWKHNAGVQTLAVILNTSFFVSNPELGSMAFVK